ncbi:phytochelatin synthase family protein [Chamaesiphon polymorphus]|uniref:glutathione gamma-glutamylcysteinyltransferase n=1 Tax=Chamaesiphon polymorphus CCALA 037 TaxID=2107692 RepID=A0A2T1GI15_9CYAN|nr:phytochelatin synthase family protein [Chamaesiphon polymorphus]PSB57367.1 glutathione gamma-glutamylcysteinyltransferase [Chamaesiphon polymorphus CCALA 037]
MKHKFFWVLALFTLSLNNPKILAQTLPLSPQLIPFSSSDGEQLLVESQAKQDYFLLSNQFVTQVNQAYCGVASSVMVLNALGLPAPESAQYKPFRVFTQDNFFDREESKKVISPELVSKQGMTLAQLGGLLTSHGAKVTVYYGSDVDLAQFRSLLVQNLAKRDNFAIVNYLRKTIGQERGGHISPIAAYNQRTDRFLILDVSRYKYPPVWVKTVDLWQAIKTMDTDSGKTRGFVLVSK